VSGRSGLVCAEHGYHGHVGFSLAMDDPPLSDPYRPLTPGITRVPFDDVDAVDAAVGDETAAVIMETVPATGGYLVPSPGFFPAVRRICDERGALLILDEVQTGLGRTGKLWALEHFDVVPDAVIVGKGLSAGIYPVAACCFGDRLEAHFERDPFFHPSSYAGSEIGARVVQAVIARYGDGELLDHVNRMGERLKAGLEELVVAYPDRLEGCRGLGLMLALDTRSEAQGFDLTKSCFEHGLLAIFAFNRQATLQVMPPLVIEEAEVDEVLERLEAAIAAM
jgi:acetylornithine/succinyldiaminopimelate/putrescine aminotransferase